MRAMFVCLAAALLAALAAGQDAACTNSTSGAALPNGSPCDDGNQWTTGDACYDGQCDGRCTRIVYQGNCVSSCPSGLVADGTRCSTLARGCGAHCLECAPGGGCARCEYSKFLEYGKCKTECSIKGSDNQPSYTVETQPLGRYCTVAPSSGSDGSGLGSQTTLIIIIISAVVGTAMVATALYCIIERRRRRDGFVLTMPRILDPEGRDGRTNDPYGDEVRVAHDEGAMMDAVALGAMGDHVEKVDAPQQKKTRARRDDERRRSYAEVEAELAQGDAATDSIIDNVPTTELALDEARYFFAQLDKLRKERATFTVILREMKRRQQRHADDRRSAAKYAEIVADLTRLLRLFKQPKNSRQVPLDGMRLLSWCQQMLDRFMSAQLSGGGKEKGSEAEF